MAKVIGIISLKGGVGKTTTTANLGALLSRQFNKEVLMVDANFTAPDLALHFGLTKPRKTLHHILLNQAEAHEAIHQQTDRLHLLPGSIIGKRVNPFSLKHKLAPLQQNYDIILLDSSPNLNEEVLATMIAADELLVVTTPDYPTLNATLRAVNIAKRKKTPITGLIINKVRNKKFELSLHEIEKAVGIPVLSVIPDDISVLEALSTMKPVVAHNKEAPATIELKKLAASLVGKTYNDPRLFTAFKELLLGRKKGKDYINRQELMLERD